MAKQSEAAPRRISTRTAAANGYRMSRVVALVAAIGVIALAGGCSSIFNPSFINQVAAPPTGTTGTIPAITLNNAPGHVAILLINNTRFDPLLLDFLETTGADLGDTEPIPRIRVRVNITYANGSENTLELISGSEIVEGSLTGGTPPELTEFPLTNFVGVCDIASVTPEQVELYVPVTRTTVQIVETQNVITREVLSEAPPAFVVLQPDTVDDNGNVTVVRNFDIRKGPVLVNGVRCGSVIGFTASGTVQVPFIQVQGATVPGFLDTDTAAQAATPGRFEFLTNVR